MKYTKKMLEILCERINDELGLPNEPYVLDDEGQCIYDENHCLVQRAGVVYLTGAYGGYRFERMCKGGGASDLLMDGFMSKKMLYISGHAYVQGLRTRLV